MLKHLLYTTFILFVFLSLASAEVVCSEDELVREIVEDINYNGIY